ncbi:MAG: RluA family pseudouridine synthase [Anaerovoracaceae bacterium]
MVKIEIQENDAGQRLDRFLRKRYNNAKLSFIYKMARTSLKLNGKKANIKTVLNKNDVLEIFLNPQIEAELIGNKKINTAKVRFETLYENADILIINKPYGVLTHGTKEEKKETLTNQVYLYLMNKEEYDPSKENSFSPAAANRLDRNTTGVITFGKTAKGLRNLNTLFRERDEIKKYYLTIVKGELTEEQTLEASIIKDENENKVTVSSGKKEEEAKSIVTKIYPLSNKNGYSLVKVELSTGRTHQIRAQLAVIGHPIIGDNKYGNKTVNKFFKEKFNLSAQLLHSNSLQFSEEASKDLGIRKEGNNIKELKIVEIDNYKIIEIVAKPPEQFNKIIKGLGLIINE